MITIYVKDFNSEVTQESYDAIIHNLDINTLQCPNCNHFNFKIHGYYDRPVKTSNDLIRLVVMRVKCLSCGRTHAILLSLLVPYQSIQLKEQIRIINNDNIDTLMLDNPFINESDISRVKYNYKHFYSQRLISEKIILDDNITLNSFKYFKRQFLQIKQCSNILCT